MHPFQSLLVRHLKVQNLVGRLAGEKSNGHLLVFSIDLSLFAETRSKCELRVRLDSLIFLADFDHN